jgi:hypothetical protein
VLKKKGSKLRFYQEKKRRANVFFLFYRRQAKTFRKKRADVETSDIRKAKKEKGKKEKRRHVLKKRRVSS